MLHLRTLGGLKLSGPSGDSLSRRRNDLAVLAVLADRSPAAIRREELQTLFWGERPEENARHSLRQVVLRLRQVCSDAVDADTTSLRLLPDFVRYDAREFAAAATAGRCREAIDLWTGDYLLGCEDLGAEAFRAWLEVERERLRRLLAFCYERTIVELEAAGDLDRATEYASGWAERFPLDERPHQRFIELLCRIGRLADATVAHGTFIRRRHAEMDDEPSAGWLAATDRALRDARDADAAGVSSRAASTRAAAAADAASVTSIPIAESALPAEARASVTPRRRWMSIVAVVAGVCAVVMLGVRIATARSRQPPTLAVGAITSARASDSLNGFGTLLNINLARIPGLDLISERRMSEVAVGMRSGDLDAVARAAGAREIIEGVLTRRSDGTLRADLRRTDLATGKTRAAYSLEGADLTQLADLLTEQIARDLKVPAPSARREGTTNSIVAYRFYEQGLRAYHEGDSPGARRFFAAALDEDSTFAMAALYNGLVSVDSADLYLRQAVRHAARTNERERLLINIALGRRMADPRVISWADTLVTRYPSEPDAHLVYAQQLTWGANPAAGLPHFRRVLDMDSTTGRTMVHCRACDALAGMSEIYRNIDSLDAAGRVARIWLRWQPRSAPAWSTYSSVMGESDQFPQAHAAIDSARKYSNDGGSGGHEEWWFRANDYESVDSAWRVAEHSRNPELRLEGLWTHVISSRAQGRMRDALSAAQEYRRNRRDMGTADGSDGLLEAVVLAETGQPRKAVALFDTIARSDNAPFASRRGATRAWALVHAAGAYASLGDTAALRRLEDTVRVNGALATERHQRLHHYVRGLLLATQHKPAEAAEAFRRAVWVRQATHARIYLELARSLLAAGRPAEAIPPLIEALKGPVSAAGLYATRTEFHELLAAAYEQSGQRDSALVQYKLVSRAWRNADPEFAARRASADARIVALTRLRLPREDSPRPPRP